MGKPTDIEILELIKNEATRERGFTLLVNKYKQDIYWVIRRIVLNHEDTNDILQNTFIKIWRHIPFFKEHSQLFTWIYRIAVNETFSFLKAKKAQMHVSMEEMIELMGETLKADPYFSGTKIQQKLWQEVQKLSPKQKIIFILRYYNGLSYDQMAKILRTNINTLKVSYHQALQKLLKNISSDE